MSVPQHALPGEPDPELTREDPSAESSLEQSITVLGVGMMALLDWTLLA